MDRTRLGLVPYRQAKPVPHNGENESHRILFMNLLSQLPNSANIIVIYYGSMDDLEKDKDYGRRIRNWHEQNTIRLINGDGAEAESETSHHYGLLYPFHPSLLQYIENDIILYLDGSLPIIQGDTGTGIGGADTLEAGFELIQQDSQLLVGSQVYDGIVSGRDDSAGTGTTSNLLQGDPGHFGPACGSYSIEGMNEDSIIHYSGMFLHKNYLCFIWHNIFAPVREMVDKIGQRYHQNRNDKLISLVISSIVPQLSGLGPALYPLMKPSWSNGQDQSSIEQSRRLSEAIIMDSGDLNVHAELPRRRRTIWDITHANTNANTIELEPVLSRRKLSDTRSIWQTSAPPPSQSSDLKPEEIAIINYFGSHSKGPTCWCNGSVYEKEVQAGTRFRCRDKCAQVADINRDELPWMRDISRQSKCN